MDEKFFWDIVKMSGKNCENINKIREKIKRKNPEALKNLDEIFSKYHALIWAKFEPLLGDYYSEDSTGFKDFVFYLLSKGKDKIEKFLNKDYNANYFKDMSKFNVEYKILDKLYHHQSKFQLIQIFKTKDFGNILVIDNDIQLTQADEKNYHEMIAHVPLNYFNNEPIKVLIIGGGDGGTLREVIRHNNVSEAVMIEIDEEVVNASKKFLPTLSNGAFEDKKSKLMITDGYKYVESLVGKISPENKFDVVIIDSTDFNQSLPLHTPKFYNNIKKIIKDKHMICFNGDNVNWNEKNIVEMYNQMKQIFKFVNPYTVYTPTFAGGFYSFCLCSDSINPLNFEISWDDFASKRLSLDYYSPEIHKSSFILPNRLDLQLYKDKPKSTGLHYVLTIDEVNYDLLNNEPVIDKIFTDAIKLADMKLLNKTSHKFTPQGVTGLYLLSTSHASYHTYPENKRIFIDLFSCGDKNKTRMAINYIIKQFKSSVYKLIELDR